MKLIYLRHLLLKCLYEARKVSGQVYVCCGCLCFHVYSIQYWNCSDNVVFPPILLHMIRTEQSITYTS